MAAPPALTTSRLGALPQLPGVGPQRFPSEYGFGFSAEGDWKTAVLVRIGAVMGYGLEGGASLMEDYSYNFTPGNEMIMGSHMLEVSPSVGTIAKPKLEIHPLGIGGKADPVRLVFTVAPKKDAVVVSMSDVRERFRLTMNLVDVVEPLGELKQLPCARGLWKPQPDLKTSAECWLRSGASHHTCMTTSVGREAWEDFARIAVSNSPPSTRTPRPQNSSATLRSPKCTTASTTVTDITER